ncbi:MAG: transposase domain-containing protein [Symbiobacteriaceae bacterium]|nr:transposase domain-containing protein [Symbiobacteriaceae bacterium]
MKEGDCSLWPWAEDVFRLDNDWLFASTVAGVQASSVVYSLIETAKANGLKPFEYLEFLFETLPNAKSNMIDSLLPWGEAIPQRCKPAVMEY